jgi:putative tryptophan/tyrosine transport system substrate-binding protein
MPTMGIIHSGSKDNQDQEKQIATLILHLEGEGYVHGQDGFSINGPHWAHDDPAKLRSYAEHLVQQGVNVLVAAGGSISSQVAKEATQSSGTPVVFTSASHPVSPAPNMTGICARTTELDPTRLTLLHELVPAAKKVGALVNSARPQPDTKALDDAAAMLGLQPLDYKDVRNGHHHGGDPDKIKQAFHDWAAAGIKAALVTANPFFNNHRRKVVDAARHAKIPAIYQWREFVDAGGLMSYGPKLSEAYKLAALYVARILRKQQHHQPKDLPVALLSKFELVINLSTAKELGVAVPETLRARADDLVV